MFNSIVPSIVRSYKGKSIRVNPIDQYVCLTDMAAASGKQLHGWTRTDKSKSYLETLSAITQKSVTELLHVGEGNTGTWGHPKVAIRFAQWCSDEFAVQIDFWIDELMTTGSVSIAPQIQRQLAPQRDLIDYIEALNLAGVLDSPILKSLITQRAAEQLGGNTLAATQQVIVTVRAQELGYSQKQIGNGSALGSFVVRQGCEPTGKTYHGTYRVNTYDLTPELDRAISLYFS